ncbi:MAG: hypothetical protein ACREBU_07650, partial [Nitrososphaera sp.]
MTPFTGSRSPSTWFSALCTQRMYSSPCSGQVGSGQMQVTGSWMTPAKTRQGLIIVRGGRRLRGGGRRSCIGGVRPRIVEP